MFHLTRRSIYYVSSVYEVLVKSDGMNKLSLSLPLSSFLSFTQFHFILGIIPIDDMRSNQNHYAFKRRQMLKNNTRPQ